MMSFDRKTFAADIDVIRAYLGKSWRDVADESHVPASTLSRLAHGKGPDVDTLVRLAVWGKLDLNKYLCEDGTVNNENTV